MFRYANEPDLKTIELGRWIERYALAAVALLSTLELGLWLLPGLDRWAPSAWSEMSIYAAIGLLLSAGSLALTGPKASATAQQAGPIATAMVIGIGVGVLILNARGINIVGGYALPSPQTGGTFLILGACTILLWTRSFRLATDTAIVILWAMVLFMIGGHIFHAASFYAVPDGRLVAPQTLFSFFLLALVVVGRVALQGSIFSVLINSGLGSRILRNVTGVIVVLPFAVFALVGYLYESGTLPASFTRAAFAPLVVILVFFIIGWMSVRINQLETSLRSQSVTDDLTGVLNRRGFSTVSNHLVHASRRLDSPLTVFYFDLDGLKEINDTLGHSAGSDLIKRFSALLNETFRRSDIIARVGGDEFVVLATVDRKGALALVDRMAVATRRANADRSLPFQVSYSTGFAVLETADANGLDHAMTLADGFMYQQKRAKESNSKRQSADQPPRGAHIEWHI